jgi:hypothetical protein
MAVHWFAVLCFVVAGLSLAAFLLRAGWLTGKDQKEDHIVTVFFVVSIIAFLTGLIVALNAKAQDTSLGSRNKKEFTSRGFNVLSAHGHSVCVKAGIYKLCLQERKDVTGKKQLVMPTTVGFGWVVINHGFVKVVDQAPHQ